MADSTKRYLLRGQEVTVLVRPNQRRKDRPAPRFLVDRIGQYAPTNVLIEFPDGTRQVRPFRGVRRIHA